jgi:single-stranded DNA-binding protein
MDCNLFVVGGVIAAPPEFRETESGTTLLRYLVTTRSALPHRRVDVLPAVQWNPSPELCAEPGEPGDRVWIVGAIQRRFWEGDAGRRSGLELVADHVELRDASFGFGNDR